MRVLVVEDDADVAQNIVQRLCAFNQWTVLLRNGDTCGAVAEFHFVARSH